MSKSYEETVADAILDVIQKSDLHVDDRYLWERPALTPEIKAFQDEIGAAAIRVVAEWNLAYAARARH